ncbi:MAG: FtsQ-type POTRA domain-containing protein [Coriobacteriales bacterium]|nr:FtsQ-type POTRA domain-containing protein [Coriobacteriales bacterium]
MVSPQTPRVLDSSQESEAAFNQQAPYSSAKVDRTRSKTGSNRPAAKTGASARTATGASTKPVRAATRAATRTATRTSKTAKSNVAQSTRAAAKSAGSAATQPTVKKRSRLRARFIIALVILVALAGGYIALYNSDLFPITNIRVAGTVHLNNDYALETAAVPEDSTFLRLDTEGISARLLALPWIKEVNLERVFPSDLVITITEQPIAATVDIVPERAGDQTSHWLIADDGTWIAASDNQDATQVVLDNEQMAKLTKIKDVSAAVRPESGAVERDPGISNALAILKGFSSEMRAMVAAISAPDAVKTTLTLYNNVGVAFGAAEDIPAKEDAIATLLEEHKGKITYINVRVANRATYRATE